MNHEPRARISSKPFQTRAITTVHTLREYRPPDKHPLIRPARIILTPLSLIQVFLRLSDMLAPRPPHRRGPHRFSVPVFFT